MHDSSSVSQPAIRAGIIHLSLSPCGNWGVPNWNKSVHVLTTAIAMNVFSDLGVLYLLSEFMKLLQAELFICKLGQI